MTDAPTPRYRWRLLPGIGHFPHEEAPAIINADLLDWLEATRRSI